MPLTGDASDRRYFRVIAPDGSTFVLALHAAPFSYDTLPFVNVAALLRAGAAAGAGDPRPRGRSRPARAPGSRRRHAAGASRRGAGRPSTPPLYRQAVGFIELLQRRGRELASPTLPPLRDRLRRREAHVGARVLRQALLRGVPRAPTSRRPRARRSARSGRRSSRSWPPSRACSAIATTTAAT